MKVPQLNIHISQGSAATNVRPGGRFNFCFLRRSLPNSTVKELSQEAQLSQRGRAMPRVVEYFR